MTKEQFHRITEARNRFALSRSSWYRGIEEGRFPRGIKLSSRCVAWRESDLDKLAELLAEAKDWRDA